ncbi:hypothetical protein J6W34_05030 [bacterium]|nr:hypothetical protein [bacterium]
MTDNPKIEDMRCILYNGDVYINKKDLISIVKKVCTVLEEPYDVYIFNNICAETTDMHLIMECVSKKFEMKIIKYEGEILMIRFDDNAIDADNDTLFKRAEKLINLIDDCKATLTEYNFDLTNLELAKTKVEYKLNVETNFKELGLTNKEQRTLYIENHEDIVDFNTRKMGIEYDINTAKQELDYYTNLLKLYNRVIDYRIVTSDKK